MRRLFLVALPLLAVTLLSSLLLFAPTAAEPAGYGWTVVNSPTTNDLVAVAMVSANEGWAVGAKATILHFQNGVWETTTSPITNSMTLNSISMPSSNEGWATAWGTESPGNFGSRLLRYDGSTWSAVPGLTNQFFRDVSALPGHQVWIAGGGYFSDRYGQILHYDGTTMQTQWISGYPYSALGIHMLSPTLGWAVGGASQGSAILKYDGHTWQSVTNPTTGVGTALDFISPSDGWTIGYHGLILHYDGVAWQTVASPTANYLWGISAVASNDVWAVGNNGTILHYDGSSWLSVPSPTTQEDLEGISMLSATDGWAVGSHGTILHYGPLADTPTPSPSLTPSITPTGPTPTPTITSTAPACSISCSASAGGWAVNISCESGSTSSTSESFRFWDDTRGWVTSYSIDRTYQNSGRTYHIEAEYWQVYTTQVEGRLTVDVTGGVFGANTQHCQNYGSAATLTPTTTATSTSIPSSTPTSSPSMTPTVLQTATPTPSATPSVTPTMSSTPTPSSTVTYTATVSPTPTATATVNHPLFLPIIERVPPDAPSAPILSTSGPTVSGLVTLTWTTAARAKAYLVLYGSTPNPDDAQVIYITSETQGGQYTYTVPLGTSYFRVSAVNDWGLTNSNIVAVTLQPTATPTATRTPTLPPTPLATMTPRPPSSSRLQCGATSQGWYLDVVGESGSTSSTSDSYQLWDDRRGWVSHYDIDRTYVNTGRTYHITAEYWRIFDVTLQGRVWADVTGGVFRSSTQYCQNY